MCQFTEVDVVRHPLVQEIVRAYDGWEQEKAQRAREERKAGEARQAAEPQATSEQAAANVVSIA
jgi:phosphate starvation-inducible PhoH-like protein